MKFITFECFVFLDMFAPLEKLEKLKAAKQLTGVRPLHLRVDPDQSLFTASVEDPADSDELMYFLIMAFRLRVGKQADKVMAEAVFRQLYFEYTLVTPALEPRVQVRCSHYRKQGILKGQTPKQAVICRWTVPVSSMQVVTA